MKAKEYYERLKASQNEEEFFAESEKILYDLVADAEKLIHDRHARQRSAIESCILEVNDKYKAICRLHDKYRSQDSAKEFFKSIILLEDGFKAVYVQCHPEHNWVFNLNAHLKKIEENEHKQKMKKDQLYFHQVTPFEDLTMENLQSEILMCMASLGNFASLLDDSVGLTLECAKPLAQRITLLRWWMQKGKIDLDDVKDWEVNKDQWCKTHFS